MERLDEIMAKAEAVLDLEQKLQALNPETGLASASMTPVPEVPMPMEPHSVPNRKENEAPIPVSLVGRSAWSLQLQENKMAMGVDARRAADEEARADVEVMNSTLEKNKIISAKIAATLARIEESSRTLQNLIDPIYEETHGLQVLINNANGCIAAIDKMKEQNKMKGCEEDVIRKGPEQAGLSAYLDSVKRVGKALSEMKQKNMRSNQQAVADLTTLLKSGNTQLEQHFLNLLQEDSEPIEPLHYITKDKPFPVLSPDKTTRLGLINQYIVGANRKYGSGHNPLQQAYADVRGPSLTATLQNLATATLNTLKKKDPTAIYKQGTNGMGTYAKGMEYAFLAEYDNICSFFTRNEWARVFNLTCQGSISELTRTLREVNSHIKANLTTDCYLAYEIIEIMSSLSESMEKRTGELKPLFAAALKPIRETGKSSLAELLVTNRHAVDNLPTVLPGGAALPLTAETMTRLQTMVDFLRPISSIMISIGDNGWKATNITGGHSVTDQIPSLASFDVTADGTKIFANYCYDTITTLISSLNAKYCGAHATKQAQTFGVFIANNASVIEQMIKGSDLGPIMEGKMGEISALKKKGFGNYWQAWEDASRFLMDQTRTPRSSQPGPVNSSAVLKSLSTKDIVAIKAKFTEFNGVFQDLLDLHIQLGSVMEKEIKGELVRGARDVVEPMYGRFWDRYHEIDKGKGKYVKWDKGSINAVFLSME